MHIKMKRTEVACTPMQSASSVRFATSVRQNDGWGYHNNLYLKKIMDTIEQHRPVPISLVQRCNALTVDRNCIYLQDGIHYNDGWNSKFNELRQFLNSVIMDAF